MTPTTTAVSVSQSQLDVLKSSKIMSLAFSAAITTTAFGNPVIGVGKIEASTTRKPEAPWTLKEGGKTNG